MSDPRWPSFWGASYLNRFVTVSRIFFRRSLSRTYDVEKPVEYAARTVDAKLLSAKTRRRDFHIHSGNHFIANLFWRLDRLFLGVVLLGIVALGIVHGQGLDDRRGDLVEPWEVLFEVGV